MRLSFQKYEKITFYVLICNTGYLLLLQDLVKSHLMFAVREEVDVLKEKITELVDKISQLEFENGILKASASQETLSKLSQQQQQQQQLTMNQIIQNPQTQSTSQQQPST